ncbi:hypothetical protein F443_18522 [Phytophthora nicotianae P1569]|uniref:Uncharacterized protein n=2 Tax=Phytophthora nicotianae TaxID=4792 RepID=V9E7M7_PHYNI|nr:hypothetical protein F443_18522 [Phytophthora nicotianae P1569]ETO63859.1 hypothetical protein F444_18513 [Phytophthora nicotianae P1976]
MAPTASISMYMAVRTKREFAYKTFTEANIMLPTLQQLLPPSGMPSKYSIVIHTFSEKRSM